jgi:hypothetical protein
MVRDQWPTVLWQAICHGSLSPLVCGTALRVLQTAPEQAVRTTVLQSITGPYYRQNQAQAAARAWQT